MNEEGKSVPMDEISEFWLENARSLLKDSIKSIEDTAKQIIAVSGILEGIYFHAIAYSEIRSCINLGAGILYLLPLALWLIAIYFAIKVFSPRVYETNIGSDTESKETFMQMVCYKHKKLRISQTIFLLASSSS